MIHIPSVDPTGVEHLAVRVDAEHQAAAEHRGRQAASASSVRSLSLRRPRFQPAWMPTASSASSGSIDSMKVGLKYGGPTETVPRPQSVGDQRRQRAGEHRRRGDHQQHVVEEQERLARAELEPGRATSAAAPAMRTG